MTIIKARLFTTIVFLISVLTLFAQRPKIGLTLSGGGAKGLAHVGILQAIDSAGLKVDYITGTSMGSIIGAMYASGYSGNQIDSIAKRLNWEELLSGKPKYSAVAIEEKNEFGKYSLEIPMKGFKPILGTGLIESEEVWLQFSEIFFHVYDQKDYSKFDIPFKCIATDLSNGNAVVLDSGEIVKSLRSSMAIPSIFASVEHANTHYIDGGVVRNFPVSDVREMGANYVIGVNLFSGLETVDNLNSAIDVMYQITNYRDAHDLVEQKKRCNILIEPPLDDYSAGSFSSSSEILDIGYQMREKYYPVFKRLADSLYAIEKTNYNPYSRYKSKKTVIIDTFKIKGLISLDEHEFLEKMRLKTGVEYTVSALNKAFRRHYSTLNYQHIYYELEPTTEGHAVMWVILKEQLPDMFKVGFSYHSFSTPAIFLNYSMRNLFMKKSFSMVKIALSEDLKGLVKHEQYFGSHLDQSLGVQLRYVQQRIPIYENNELKSQYKTATSVTDFIYSKYFGKDLSTSFYLSSRNISFSPKIASTFRYDGNSKDLYSKLQLNYNTTNRLFLPTNGIDAYATAGVEFLRRFNSQYSGNDSIIDTAFSIKPIDPLLRFDFGINTYNPLNKKLSIIHKLQGGVLFDDNNFHLDNFLIGGSQKLYLRQKPFVGYMDGQITATSFLSYLIGAQYKLMGELYVQGKCNIGLYNFLTANSMEIEVEDRFISGFSSVIAYNISMLPIEFSVNYSPEIRKLYSHIRIGFIF